MDIKGLIYYFHRSKTSVVFKVGELHWSMSFAHFANGFREKIIKMI
jgi:hypothetical protein